ncbi:MAG: ribosome assembly RNA-binding protein YhbY [Clostridium sp.]|jgi:RNA-binding protein|nr:ribosome assembly RNA-binding protein YhbY [Clostridium sp.]
MLTGKQRAYLRKLAHNLDPIFQVGKNGVEETFIKQVEEALEKRELIKIKVLDNSLLEAREVSDMICEEIGCEGIQAIGSKLVLYKKSKKNPQIELDPNKKLKKEAPATRNNSKKEFSKGKKGFSRIR